MDRYHSIVGPIMVSYHWKPLENHCYQWFWRPKTIEKPLLAMVFGPKSIGKPLLPMVLETKNHHKTIDINGDFPSIHSMAMVSIKTFYSPLLSHPKPNQCTIQSALCIIRSEHVNLYVKMYV